MTNNQPPMDSPDDRGAELSDCAHQAETAVTRLVHLTINRPSLTLAEVDVVLAHLAETVAALPQVAAQLGDILDRSRDTHLLAMDDMSATTDPDLAIDTARLHLKEVRGPAVQTYRHLDAARNEVAHIRATPLDYAHDTLDVASQPDIDVRDPRPEDRQPSPAARPGTSGPAR